MFSFLRWAKATVCVALLCLGVAPAFGASLLPNGKQQFIDGNGVPLAGGSVYFYIPGTTVQKNTWQDAGQTILNPDPVILDGNGYAVIYGSGAYRQVVKDSNGNIVWDQLTADTTSSESSWAGNATGTANVINLNAPNFSSQSGQTIDFRAIATNTGAVVVNVNGAGGISIVKDLGGGITNVPLVGGEISTGALVEIAYDSTAGVFHLDDVPSTDGPVATVVANATTALPLAQSREVIVTGSGASITSFGTPVSLYSPLYTVSFTGANTIIYNANTMITPSGVNITTAPGDFAIIVNNGTYSGAAVWQILTYIPGTPSTVSARAHGVTVVNGSSPNTKLNVVTATAVMINPVVGGGCYASNISATLDASTVGANGLSTDVPGGALAASTWYYVYEIYNATTSTAGVLLSTSATAPALPTGYGCELRIGAWRTDGSANFYRLKQAGRKTQWVVVGSSNVPNLPVMASGSVGNVSTPTWVAVATGNFVPPTAVELFAIAESQAQIIVAPNAAYGGYTSASNPPPVVGSFVNYGTIPFDFVLETSNIYWAANNANAAIFAFGWVDATPLD